MKNLLLILAVLALAGCHHDPYDVSADVAKTNRIKPMKMDPKLVPGAKETEVLIPAGQKLPDGTVAEKDTKLKMFTAPLPPGGPWQTKKK